MPWPIFMVADDDPDVETTRNQPGACWFLATGNSPKNQDGLSPEYLRDWYGKRPPLVICTPDGNWWLADFISTDGVSGWAMTGDPPNLTARPSIGSSGYHGFLTNGVLSDDIEGRTYPPGGTP